MKTVITNLSDNYLQDYTLKKVIENRFISEKIDADDLIYDNNHDFNYLLESTANGDDLDEGVIQEDCEGEIFEKDIFIKHNNGRFNLKECIATKPLSFKNVLDCVANSELNIFDYPASQTTTIQGQVDTDTYSFTTVHFIGDQENTITLDLLQGIVGSYPDKSNLGFYPEFISYSAEPLADDLIDDATGTGIEYQQYRGHKVVIFVKYIRIRSSVKHSSLWIPIPSSLDFFYSQVPALTFGASESRQIVFQNVNYYTQFEVKAGKLNTYTNIPISNTIVLAPIIEDIFSCTGLTVISNFLNINPDGSQPQNDKYDFADQYCKELKIVQSFDIIRESAIQDSFGVSGKFKVKDLLSDILFIFNLNIIPDNDLGIIRIEHVSYFTTKGIDLSEKDYELSELEMNKDKIDSEIFQFAAPTPTDGFYELKIEYENKDIYSDQNENTYKAKVLITDVFGTLNNQNFEGNEYKKLFFIISTENDQIIGFNRSLSMDELVSKLHDIHRPVKVGKIKGQPVTFEGFSIGLVGDIKIFGSIKQWSKIWPYYSVKIKEGTFLIKEIEYNNAKELKLSIIK